MIQISDNPINTIRENNENIDEETLLSSVPTSASELISYELWSKLPIETRKMIYLQMIEVQMVSSNHHHYYHIHHHYNNQG